MGHSPNGSQMGAAHLVKAGLTLALGLPVTGEGNALFASEKLLASHFAEHAAEFGFKTAAEYFGAARKFFGGEAETVMRGTDKLFYNEATNEFGVLGGSGNIRTYFKPTEGRAYWDRIIQGLK